MKQIIPFVNDLSFGTSIFEITSIALENNLQMENNDSIVGNFIVSGKYRINNVSINEESFEKEISFDITLDDKYDASKVKIDIDDFYYEIINDDVLRVHIDVQVDNLVYYKQEDILIEEKKIMPKEDILSDEYNTRLDDEYVREETIIEDIKENMTSEIQNSITTSFINEKDNYVTYKVHIVRENESVETIKELYKIPKEELEKYNNIDNVSVGDKIIVPVLNE